LNGDSVQARMNTDLEALTQKIHAAFADVPWQYEAPAENLTPANAFEVMEDFFLISDSDKHYELPRVMSVAITEAKPPLLKELLCRLIEFWTLTYMTQMKQMIY